MTISVRHQARILVMQALYEWDSADHDPVAALERQLHERGVAARVAEFARSLLGGVQAHQQEIDDHLALAAPQRPLTQMARVEKAILRLAIFEILYNNNAVPSRAAINEAIELAKTYGSENSGRFVNGVLGTIFSHAETPISDNTTSRK